MTALRPSVREVDLAKGVALARSGYLVIDVREADEWRAGHVAGAVHLPLAEVATRIGELVPERGTRILVHCAVGARSAQASAWLAQVGYTEVANLRAPISRWSEAGGDWEAPTPDDAARAPRYARQVLIPEVGVDGQRRLLAAKVLLIGAGGLGSPVALYLAAAGVGRIGIVDDDVVEESNLARQVLHGADRLGMRKVDSAALTLRSINPDTHVSAHPERVHAGSVDRIIGGHDVIIDGTDNLEARYLINDAAVRQRIPVVHGSIYRWQGQVTTFLPFEGPCYRCLHPDPPPPELAPECSVAGVVGVMPGLVGMLQATEALKLLLGAGELLVGRLLLVDALGTTFDELTVPRDPACPTCGAA